MLTKRSGDTKNKSFRSLFKKLEASLERYPFLSVVALSFILTFIIEVLNRHSIWNSVLFLFTLPVRFAANMSIVLVSLSIGLFFRKRFFSVTVLSVTWLGLGITNAIVQLFRIAPFGFIDIALLPSVFTILPVYMKPWQIILIIAAALILIVFAVFLYIKTPKRVPIFRSAFISLLISAAALCGTCSATVAGKNVFENEALNSISISDAYRQYGFSYCFCTEAIDRGITKPDFYSRDAVIRLMSRLKTSPEPELYPNIIMLQLESFFDVARLEDVTCDAPQIPVFTELRENYSSGFLTVPSIGSGTANTEFEVLSGMSLDFFGLGEYPYSTILQDHACETVATDLKALGYTAHAVHNNSGTFYDRNTVFAQLGFDNFIPIEFMEHVEYNPTGWAKDRILTNEIFKALDSTPGRDFVFTITVQGHGKYQPETDFAETDGFSISRDGDKDQYEDDTEAFAYYLSQLRETDAFIGELLALLQRRAEPTVLVLYGDHLPNLNISTEELINSNLYTTEYVIWNNIGLPTEDKDLSAYQLTSEVMRQLGIDGGTLSMYHQQMSEKAGYSDGLKLLEYDMLYGKFYCYGGVNPYKASDLRMGVSPIVISDAVWEDGKITLSGTHFTPWSRITVDGDELDTIFENNGTITAKMEAPPNPNSVITVRQVTSTSVTLYESVGLRWSPV